jgi:prepilin-type N-terminal cleavage/methylation domain-containing protein
MKSRGFTLIEVLSVIVIIATLAAISYPVFAQAKMQAKRTVSAEKLRQLFLATEIYRNDNDGFGYGDLGTMGLPDGIYVFRKRFGLPEESIRSACRAHPDDAPRPGYQGGGYIWYRPGLGEEDFVAEVRKWRENYPLYVDMHCNDPAVQIWNWHVKKYGVAVLLSGEIVKVNKFGRFQSAEFWKEPASL